MTGAPLDTHVVVRRRDFRLHARLTVDAGEVVALMGPSGAGKSTLLTAVAGLTRLSGGHVRIGDHEVAAAADRLHVRPARRGAVLLGQNPRLFPHLNARANVAFGLRARGVPRKLAIAEADDWLWRVGLPGAGDHLPSELSGGQQQRIAVARALATAPKVLLLDEPLTALDPETAADVRAMLHEQLSASRVTALVVTHDAVDAAALATRLVVVEGGEISQEGPVAAVLAAPMTSFAAAVAGRNRVVGVAREGAWSMPAGERATHPPVVLAAADRASRAAAAHEGDRLSAVFRPGAVQLSAAPDPSWTGALRLVVDEPAEPGCWLARVVRIERTPGGARVHTSFPAVAVDVAADEVAALGLAPGHAVRLRIAPEHVRLLRAPDHDAGSDAHRAHLSR